MVYLCCSYCLPNFNFLCLKEMGHNDKTTLDDEVAQYIYYWVICLLLIFLWINTIFLNYFV